MKTFIAAWASVVVLALALLPAQTASGGTFKRIAIDGSFDDWIGVPLAYEDPADSETSADYRKIWIANDDEYLYIRFTLERPDDPFTGNDNLFIDTDADSTTGFGIIVGSELLVQGGVGYQEKNGGFNEGPIGGLDWQAAPAGVGTEFELRISRSAVFESDGTPVFASDFIAILLEAEDANFTRRETAPDFEGILYDFAPPPPPLSGSEILIPLDGEWRWAVASDVGAADWRAPDYDDFGGEWSAGGALLGYSGSPDAYPAPIATPLSAEPATYYFRARFLWNYNPGSAVFVATNHVSDGAVFYLNGAEIRRVRLPAGPLDPWTPASGSASPAGVAEVFPIPPELLTLGENVLAVAVHKDPATPEDLVFGLSLLAASSFPATITDPSQPEDRAVVGGESTTFAVEAFGSAPLSYVWLKDGVEIEGATGETYTIESVLPEHAGAYSARVSNAANPSGAVRRAAALTVLSVPVEITQHPQPATVVEGRAARFTVTATGSAPLQYQWHKDGQPLEGATDAVLEIPNVTAADAGEYYVVVSNPAPSSAQSQSARLQVTEDQAPPSLPSIAGSPNRVILVFSEPVDAASAENTANYAGEGGLTVTSASVSEEDPAVVELSTSAQSLGTAYSLTIANVQDRFGNVMAPARRSFLSTIQIDGSFDDWQTVEQAVDDPADAENATDYAGVWITSDSNYVYLRVQTHAPTDLAIFYNNLFIDADGDIATGFPFRGLGSDMLIQGGSGYQQKGGGFNEGPIEGLDWLIAPEGIASEFELRFSRRATYASDGEPVFAGDFIMLFVESENTSFQTVDVAPDFEPIIHMFVNTPAVELGALVIATGADGGPVITWEGSGRLQSTASLTDPDWQDVAGASSPHPITLEGQSRFYRLRDE